MPTSDQQAMARNEIARLERQIEKTDCSGCRSKLWDEIGRLKREAGLPTWDVFRL